ncbi:MAG TPA: hypothetical protein VJ739_17380 [Gemmataceae bacterium]|nr:hypothetical protein [Gemmataceae bacterium]
MTREGPEPNNVAAEKGAIRRRVKRLYEGLNEGRWERCFALVDPRLRENSRVGLDRYSESLAAFRNYYGSVRPWYMRISLHLDASENKHDERPFAYAYVVWQDARHEFHMFRERWVKDSGHWYTRVVGLVPQVETAREVEG